MELLETCNKGAKINCWESLLIKAYQQHGVLIEEEEVNGFYPIYALAYVTGRYNSGVTRRGLGVQPPSEIPKAF